MDILGINASARKDGNCAKLLKEALKGAETAGHTVTSIFLDELNISPWREKIPEDDMRTIEARIKKADAIILASPIYFGSLSAQAKIMIDRCQTFWEKKMLFNKPIRKNKINAAFICVQASDKKAFFDNAKQIAKNFFEVIDAKYQGELFCSGLEKEADVLKHPDFLRKAYALGKNLLT